MNKLLIQKKLCNGPINGICNLILIATNKKIKLFFLINLTNNKTFSIHQFELNVNSIAKCPNQKHLGIMLDSKLDFNSHFNHKIYIKRKHL